MAEAPVSQSLQVDTSPLTIRNSGYHGASIMNSGDEPTSESQPRTPSPTSFIDFGSDDEDDEEWGDDMLLSTTFFKGRMPLRRELEFQNAASELPVDIVDEDHFESNPQSYPGADLLGLPEGLLLDDPLAGTDVAELASLSATIDAAEDSAEEGETSMISSIIEHTSLHQCDDEASEFQAGSEASKETTDSFSSNLLQHQALVPASTPRSEALPNLEPLSINSPNISESARVEVGILIFAILGLLILSYVERSRTASSKPPESDVAPSARSSNGRLKSESSPFHSSSHSASASSNSRVIDSSFGATEAESWTSGRESASSPPSQNMSSDFPEVTLSEDDLAVLHEPVIGKLIDINDSVIDSLYEKIPTSAPPNQSWSESFFSVGRQTRMPPRKVLQARHAMESLPMLRDDGELDTGDDQKVAST
ncbi:hypothetical protein SISNIDRAFT_464791 [Sistotremastrum niveocremeum HHB9708]|uniref:Uncharacterized protein n=1 Tax=Sistotremastrum niveocremeum HHB9708 TaxID=1314777 RepID=A0A164WKU3_9AGAM|nr:hypothetical protein SISNIDRAFT_464791 [Sistotremastrum niveocremeum HHB9708]